MPIEASEREIDTGMLGIESRTVGEDANSTINSKTEKKIVIFKSL